MGHKTSVVPQLDFLLPSMVPHSHRPKHLTGTKNLKVDLALRQAGGFGCTCEEIEATYGWMPNTAGPRLSEVRAMGRARKTEGKRGGHAVWISITAEVR